MRMLAGSKGRLERKRRQQNGSANLYPTEAATVSKIELENACMRDKGTKDKRDGGRKIDGGMVETRTKIFRPTKIPTHGKGRS